MPAMHLGPVIAILALHAAVFSVKGQQGALTDLRDDTFDAFVSKHERVLVQWHAVWCEQCKRTESELQQVAGRLKAQGMATQIARIDATVEKGLAGKYDINKPTLHYLISGNKESTYESSQDASSIFEWLKKRERPEMVEVAEDELEDFMGDVMEGEFALCAQVKRNSVRHKAFTRSAPLILDFITKSNDLVKFGLQWLPSEADPKKDAALTLHRGGFKQPDVNRVSFKGVWSEKTIAEWATKHLYPTFGQEYSSKYEPSLLKKIGWSGSVVICSAEVDPEDDTDSVEDMTSALDAVVDQHPDLKFTICDSGALKSADKEALLGEQHLEQVGSFISVLLGGKKRYVWQGGVEASTLQDVLGNFLTNARLNKISPRYKTEPILHQEIDDRGVMQIIGSTFDKHVMDSTKDFFVNFWHPRCDHCKDLDPVWAELATSVKKRGWYSKGVVIAKMDVSKNECQEDVEAMPKLVLYPAVKASQKMRKRHIFHAQSVEKLASLPVDKLLDFLLNTAVNLQGEEEVSMGQELAKNKRRMNKHKKSEL